MAYPTIHGWAVFLYSPAGRRQPTAQSQPEPSSPADPGHEQPVGGSGPSQPRHEPTPHTAQTLSGPPRSSPCLDRGLSDRAGNDAGSWPCEEQLGGAASLVTNNDTEDALRLPASCHPHTDQAL